MTFQTGQTARVNPTRPSSWKKKDWEIYAGFRVSISQVFERIQGTKTYLAMMEEGPLKGEQRWFNEGELVTE